MKKTKRMSDEKKKRMTNCSKSMETIFFSVNGGFVAMLSTRDAGISVQLNRLSFELVLFRYFFSFHILICWFFPSSWTFNKIQFRFLILYFKSGSVTNWRAAAWLMNIGCRHWHLPKVFVCVDTRAKQHHNHFGAWTVKIDATSLGTHHFDQPTIWFSHWSDEIWFLGFFFFC